MESPRLLVVEDDGIIGRHLQATLSKLGYQVLAVISSGDEAVRFAHAHLPDIILMDISLQGEMDGIQAATHITAQNHIPIVYLTAFNDEITLQRAKITDPFGYILKPFEERSLNITLQMALHKHELENRLRESEEHFRTLVENQSEGVGVLDLEGCFTFANPAACNILGFTQEDLIGKNFKSLVRSGQSKLVNRIFSSTDTEGKISINLNIINHENASMTLTITASPWLDKQGNITGTFFLFRDVTDAFRINKAEEDQRILAEALRDTAAALNSTLDINEVFVRILANLSRVIPHDAASINIINDGKFTLVANLGYEDFGTVEPDPKREYIISDYPNLLRMVTNHKPDIIPDTLSDPEWIQEDISIWARSHADVPILIKGDVSGFISIHSAIPNSFTATHADRLIAFSDQAAIAIQNARLFAETQQRASYLALLNDITVAALQSTDLHSMMQTFLENLGQLFKADSIYLTMWEEKDQRAIPYAAYGLRSISDRDMPVAPSEYVLTSSVLNSGKTLVANDVLNSPNIDSQLAQGFVSRSLLCLPLIADMMKIGAVLIGYDKEHFFSKEEIERGEQASRQIALAFAKVRLIEIERKKTQQLTRTNSLITSLGRIATRIETIPDSSSLLETLGRELQTFGISCMVAKLLPGSKELDFLHISLLDEKFDDARNSSGLRVRDLRSILEKTMISETMIKQQRAVFTPDLLTWMRTILTPTLSNRAVTDFLRALDITNKSKIITLPLIVGERVIAFLFLWGDNLEEDDLPAMLVFGSQVAIALENARLYTEVQQMAITDDLTGLYNRRGIFELGRREVKRAQRFNRLLSLIYVDLDFFKLVNDNYGHSIGDAVLKEIAERCRNTVREIDLIGRYGGDEFIILMPETDIESAHMVAERLLQIISQPIETIKGQVKITTSLGITSITADTAELIGLINIADEALYMAKRSGRNRIIEV
jgi:diguanylate cyclase (GGDEF)-like protein/PAS domain S-box-containing protein